MKLPNSLKYLPLAAVATLALAWSWNEPLLSSHSFRQAETAQVAQIFLLEGWTPFLPHFRWVGEPGVVVLEFPAYQSVVAGATRLTGLALENAGRLVSCFSGIALALACAMALRAIAPLLGLAGTVLTSSMAALLVFCSPLVFGTSQWVSLELMNAALAAWSFVFFSFYLEEVRPVQAGVFVTVYGLTALLSMVMKPHGQFALFPLFVWRYGLGAMRLRAHPEKRRSFLRKTALAAIVSLCAIATAIAWYRYGQRTNELFHSPYSIGTGHASLMFGDYQIWQAHVLARLAGRFVLYVLGPGSVVLFIILAAYQPQNPVGDQRKLFAGACFACVLVYLSVFTGGNFAHNYYQVATIFPLYLGIFVFLSWPRTPWIGLLTAAAILVNLTVSLRTLARQDENWKNTLVYLKARVPPGYEKPTINITTNCQEGPVVLSYSLQRRTVGKLWQTTKNEELRQGEWLGICDNQATSTCTETLQGVYSKKPSMVFGPLSLFEQTSPLP